MLFNHLGIGKIFVSIASLMDLELEPTIKDLVLKAKNPKNLFVSIYSQDDDHPDLEPFLKQHEVSYKYSRVHYSSARGVGHARSIAQSHLTSKYEYFLQIDSHMRFIENWDIKLRKDYEDHLEAWGPIIFSTYPEAYEISINGVETLINKNLDAPVVMLVKNEENPELIFDPQYTERADSDYGIETGFFCAGFSFGLSEYFLKVPPDPRIYFTGEEHTTAIRFFQEGIRIVSPNQNYCFHDYDGSRRKRHWELPEGSQDRDRESRILVRRILSGKVPDILKKDTIEDFVNTYVS